ncbi:MAG: hypothetical protein ACRC54_05080 [Fusobacteriaceae bacterium]
MENKIGEKRISLLKLLVILVKEEIAIKIAKKIAHRETIETDLANYKLVSKAKAEATLDPTGSKIITPEFLELERIKKWNGVPYLSNGNFIRK